MLRRLENRKLGRNNPEFGRPIQGELTQAEIDHKERRRIRRGKKSHSRIAALSRAIQEGEANLRVLRSRLDHWNDEDELSRDEVQALISGGANGIKGLQKSLQEAKTQSDRLTA